MASSKRTQILSALKTALDAITVVGGYNNTLKYNKLVYKMIEQIPEDKFPAVVYLPGMAPYTPLTQTEYTSGAAITGIDGWSVSVVGYVKDSAVDVAETGTLLTDMENLIEDIVEAVMASYRLGLTAFVQNVYLSYIDSVIVPGDFLYGIVEVNFVIKYDFDKDNP